ncbi:hypothetical protein ACMFMF_007031 [Clarireedia jacksonii]
MNVNGFRPRSTLDALPSEYHKFAPLAPHIPRDFGSRTRATVQVPELLDNKVPINDPGKTPKLTFFFPSAQEISVESSKPRKARRKDAFTHSRIHARIYTFLRPLPIHSSKHAGSLPQRERGIVIVGSRKLGKPKSREVARSRINIKSTSNPTHLIDRHHTTRKYPSNPHPIPPPAHP